MLKRKSRAGITPSGFSSNCPSGRFRCWNDNIDLKKRFHLDKADPVAADDANDRRKTEETGTKKQSTRTEAVRVAKARIMRRNSLRKAATSPEALIPATGACSVSGIDCPVQVAKVRYSVHRQAVLVFFALDVQFHQMLGEPFTGAPRLETVGEGAVYA
jgi:hypothetical protein